MLDNIKHSIVLLQIAKVFCFILRKNPVLSVFVPEHGTPHQWHLPNETGPFTKHIPNHSRYFIYLFFVPILARDDFYYDCSRSERRHRNRRPTRHRAGFRMCREFKEAQSNYG